MKKMLKSVMMAVILLAVVFGFTGLREMVFDRIPAESALSAVVPVKSASAAVKSSFADHTGRRMDLIFPIPVEITFPEDTAQRIEEPDEDLWFDDFQFYESVYENGIPEEAVIRSTDEVPGNWKYCMTFGRTDESAERVDEIGIAELSFEGEDAELILHPKYIRFGTHVDPEDDGSVAYEPFTGKRNDGSVSVSANGTTIDLVSYYSFEGKDYVLGGIAAEVTGMTGEFLLIRP